MTHYPSRPGWPFDQGEHDPLFAEALLREHHSNHDYWARHKGDLSNYAFPTVMVRDGYGEWTFRQYDNRAARPGGVYESYPADGPAYRRGGQATTRDPVGIPFNDMADVMVSRPRVPGGLGT